MSGRIPRRILALPATGGSLGKEQSTWKPSLTPEQIRHILQAEGCISIIDEDGDIAFKAQERKLCAAVSDDDPDYVRIFLDLLINRDDASKRDIFEAENKAGYRFKCVKCLLLHQNDDTVLFRIAIEGFTDIETIERYINRCICSVCSATWSIAQTCKATTDRRSAVPRKGNGLSGFPAASFLHAGQKRTATA